MEEISALIPGAEPTLCLLMADDATLTDRVQRRELGAGRAWHVDRAIELARQFAKHGPADFVVDTDRLDVTVIAQGIADRVAWVR